MGIKVPLSNYEQQALDLAGLDWAGLKWCELGNQRIDRKPARDVYLSRGVGHHIAIDLNGKDGAMPLDLDDPLPFVFRDQFDVVTNYGTSEHVNNQYQVFANAHDACRPGGLMIHVVPRQKNWPGHCRYFYSPDFFTELGDACRYEVLDIGLLDSGIYAEPKNLVTAIFRKADAAFVEPKQFEQIGGVLDTSDLTRTGDYNKASLKSKLRAIRDILRG